MAAIDARSASSTIRLLTETERKALGNCADRACHASARVCSVVDAFLRAIPQASAELAGHLVLRARIEAVIGQLEKRVLEGLAPSRGNRLVIGVFVRNAPRV